MAAATTFRAFFALVVTLAASLAYAGDENVGLVVPCFGKHSKDKGYEMCDLLGCTNKMTSRTHCGMCGKECAAGLVCNRGKCGKPIKVGRSCKKVRCPGGMYCSGKPAYRCMPRKPINAKCASHSECRTMRCGCGRCRPATWCVAHAHCGKGRYCQQPSCKAAALKRAVATCRPMRKKGGACVSHAMCKSRVCRRRRCA